MVGQAGDAEELLLKVRAHSPTSRSWTSACRRRTPTRACARRARSAPSYPDIGVLVLSQYVEAEYALDLLADSAEGVGYLLKDRVADIAAFAEAVRRVAEGGSALDPEVVALLLGRRRCDDPLATSPRASERCSADGRGPLQPGDRRASCSSPSARSRST